MVRVADGPFIMGSGDGDPDAGPPRRVDLPEFWIDRREVSCAEYAVYLADAGAAPPPTWTGPNPPDGWADLPVTGVTWFEALRYAIWAGKRLPTEAEWERAARGDDGRRYPWGDEDDPARRNLGAAEPLAPVDSHPQGAAPCGALNLCGNAWEWTADGYRPYPGGPPSPFDGDSLRVLRGGGATYLYGLANTGATWQRGRLAPFGRHDAVGFRCVRDADPSRAPYDPLERLACAEADLARPLPPPREPAWQAVYQSLLDGGEVVLRALGDPGWSELTRFGVPFPRGRLREEDLAGLALLDAAGGSVAHAAQRAVSWPDGSLRWLWIDARLVGGQEYRLRLTGGGAIESPLAWDGPLDDPPLDWHAKLAGGGPAEIAWRATERRATSGERRLWLTAENPAPREAEPALLTAARWTLTGTIEALRLGTDRAPGYLDLSTPILATQHHADGYTVLDGAGRELARGWRLPGWLAVRTPEGWLGLSVRWFAENHPAGFAVQADGVHVLLYAGDAPCEWEGGLAKTWEIATWPLPEAPESLPREPLRVAVDPVWLAGTQAAGPLLPRDAECLAALAPWEAARAHDLARWLRAMPTGLRDFGDAYFGGPHKGRHAFANLEYDVPLDYLRQFLRTGEARLVHAAEAQARHQADIDVEQGTGRPWKHSPRHTTTEADLGHVFVGGLLLCHALTGDPRPRQAAERIGRWLMPRLAAFQGLGNERQIGWSLLALANLAEYTGEERWLAAAADLAAELARRQQPSGRFDIRWDNRIAFFNGIAMNGLRRVCALTGDPATAQLIERLGERTLGLAPEYAARTLNGFAWLYERTGDPRWRAAAELSWAATLAFLFEHTTVAAETHGEAFLPFAVASGLLPPRWPAEHLPDPATWRSLRLSCGAPERPRWAGDRFAPEAIDLYLRGEAGAPVLTVLESVCEAHVVLVGERTESVELDRGWPRCGGLALPAAGTWRLRLSAAAPATWQVHTDARCRAVVHDPTGRQVARLYPRAWSSARPGAQEVALRLEARGEGFHTGLLRGPDGRPAAHAERFIEHGDLGRYELELRAAAAHGLWSVELSGARAVAVSGLLPYWSASAGDWFDPERSWPPTTRRAGGAAGSS